MYKIIIILSLLSSSILFCSGCFPAWRSDEEVRAPLRAVNDATGAEIDEVLYLSGCHDFWGVLTPEGPATDQPLSFWGINTRYFGRPQVLHGEQRPRDTWGAIGLISIFFYWCPIGYGGTTEMEGALIIVPGYRPVYLRSRVISSQPAEERPAIRVELHPLANPLAELRAIRQMLSRGRIDADQIEWRDCEEYCRRYRAHTVRLNTEERRVVNDFFDSAEQRLQACNRPSMSDEEVMTGGG